MRVVLGVVVGVMIFFMIPTPTGRLSIYHVIIVVCSAVVAGAFARRAPVYVGLSCWVISSAIMLYILVVIATKGAPQVSSLPDVAQAPVILRSIAMAPLWVLGAWVGNRIIRQIRPREAKGAGANGVWQR